MADDTTALYAPVLCEPTIEYDNRIEDEIETEPDEEEEHEDTNTRKNWEELEQQFARYERNYRARRIRELTLGPLKKKRVVRRSESEAAEVVG
ncbi:MAG: hypothetical protein ACOX3G_05725 [Armatimonadota bacterium]